MRAVCVREYESLFDSRRMSTDCSILVACLQTADCSVACSVCRQVSDGFVDTRQQTRVYRVSTVRIHRSIRNLTIHAWASFRLFNTLFGRGSLRLCIELFSLRVVCG